MSAPSDLLELQYQLALGSRAVMLDFIAAEVGDHIHQPAPQFDGKTIRFMLLHISTVTSHWLGNVALQKQLALPDDDPAADLQLIRKRFLEADQLVYEFLARIPGDWQIAITLGNQPFRSGKTELFTHILTHEFHHKGQIMSMCRLLGHTPPDTDVIRT